MGAAATKFFISYRRSDTAGYASWIYERLAEEFGADHVFMDVDSLPLGVDFVEHLEAALAASDIALILIGARWLEAVDDAGKRRLDDPQDFVRIEVARALQRSVPVIPVLVDDAAMPPATALPEELRPLARRQALRFERHGAAAMKDLIAVARRMADEAGPGRAEAVGPALLEERKVVTVLYCDLVGLTESSDRGDPEELRARVQPYRARLRSEIETYGGIVERFMGDAMMGVFGVPKAHEDDPERAVRAGLQIVEAISELNQEAGIEPLVRIGIETGEVLVTGQSEAGEGLVVGEVVNTASRLQVAAPADGVRVGPATHAATADAFEFEALPPALLGGKAEPVPTWHVVAARSHFGTDVPDGVTTPLVGRQIDLGMLTSCFERAVREGTVQLATIAGEPGVGKSRLVAELSEFAEARPELIRWRQGRCLPYGEGIAFWALGEIVKAEAGILETDSPEVAGSKLDAAVPDDDPDAPWLRARLRPLVGLDAPEAARDENFAAWRAFVELLAETRPTVLVFEDLHWADKALLDFVEYLADYSEGVPLLLVGTARPELSDRAPAWAAAARNTTRINLAPLSPTETAELMSNLLAEAVLPPGLQQRILDLAGGNPLYAEEFVRLLRDQELLAEDATSWRADPEAEIPLPSGIHGLIAARLDTLTSERKRLLQDAAVIGKVFWSGAVADMGEREGEEVAGALHELARKELVRPARRSSMAGQTEHAFHHALVRDVCYGQIPRAERTARHRRAAAWIEKASGERSEDHAAIIAAHYLSALEFAGIGQTSEAQELTTRAVHYSMLAGERSMSIDVEAAERHFTRALELVPSDAIERPKILARHAYAIRQRGRLTDAVTECEQAIEGFRAQGDVPAMATTMARLSVIFSSLGDKRAWTLEREALEALEPLGPSPELVEVLAGVAGGCLVRAEPERAIEFANRAIALAAELGLPKPARALGWRGSARATLGEEGAADEIRRGLEAAISQGLGRAAVVLHFNLAVAEWMSEGPGAALRTLEEAIAFAQRRGIEEFVVGGAAAIGEVLVELGHYDQALERARYLLPQLDAENVNDQLTLRVIMVKILTRRGALDEALALSSWNIERAREFDNAQDLAQVVGPGATLQLAAGEEGTARALLEELSLLDRSASTYIGALPDAVRAALALNDRELAERLTEGVPSRAAGRQAALLTARASIAEAAGHVAEAEEKFAAAAQLWERLEIPWERAHALLGQGRCTLALGRPGDAAGCAEAAREIFRSLDAAPMIAETDAVLAQIN